MHHILSLTSHFPFLATLSLYLSISLPHIVVVISFVESYMDTNTRWALMKSSHEIAPNCPRCASSNTKFCYYNNYSLSQPRYFCKGCRRYWTKGGSLRNVPVGGGCRKSRRGRSTRPLTSSSISKSDGNGPFMSQDVNTLNGNDIDMAAVFAKFLDPNLETESRDYFDHQKTDRSKDHDLFFELTSSLESNNNSTDTGFFAQEMMDETFEGSYDASFGLEDLLNDQIILPSHEAMWPSYEESLDNDVFCQSLVSQEECQCPSVTFPDSDDYNQMKGLGSVGNYFDVTSNI